MTPKHLGGHLNKTHIDDGLLEYLIDQYKIESVLDIGCGPGGMVHLAHKKGLVAFGIDGDPNISGYCILKHDFTTGKLNLNRPFDLIWSVEFLEHVEEKYLPNFMPLFQLGKYCVVTHALPGDTGGHHHVNLQESNYWVEKFNEYGLIFDAKETKRMKQKSTMEKRFIERRGLFFKNKKQVDFLKKS